MKKTKGNLLSIRVINTYPTVIDRTCKPKIGTTIKELKNLKIYKSSHLTNREDIFISGIHEHSVR